MRWAAARRASGNFVPHGLHYNMLTIRRTREFIEWIARLRDARTKARIALRIDRLAIGNPGDVKPVGDGVSELRIDHGPGYRVYFIRDGAVVIVLLCGGQVQPEAGYRLC